jgi:hypothetical protein
LIDEGLVKGVEVGVEEGVPDALVLQGVEVDLARDTSTDRNASDVRLDPQQLEGSIQLRKDAAVEPVLDAAGEFVNAARWLAVSGSYG